MDDAKIKEEFEKWKSAESYTDKEIAFSGGRQAYPIPSAYYGGFRTAERLAKIEVLEIAKQMFLDLDEMNPVDYTDSFDVINTLLEELKAGQP